MVYLIDSVRRARQLRSIDYAPDVKARSAQIQLWPDHYNDKPFGRWQQGDYQSYAEEGFTVNSIIYAAIMYKARVQMAAPLRAYKGDVDHPEPLPPSHPLAQLVARPNRHQSWPEFQALNEVYFNIAGYCPIVVAERDRELRPVRLRTLRPDRVWPVPSRKGKDEVMGYVYIPEGGAPRDGVPILPEDMMYPKLPNPLDPLEGWGRGQSPMAAVAYPGDVDNSVTRFLKSFFERGAMVAGILKTNIPIDDQTIQQLKRRWREQYGSSENWGDIAVLGHDTEFQRISMTLNEMGFDSIDKRNEARITMPFGVPAILLGTPYGQERSIQSNIEASEKQFWNDTFIPELKLFEAEYQYFLQWDNAFVRFDFQDVPALQQDRQVEAKIALDAFMARAISRGEYRQAIGYQDIDETPVMYTPPTGLGAVAVPDEIDQTNEGAAEAVSDAEQEKDFFPEGLDLAFSPERKQRFWRKVDATAESYEARFATSAKRALEKDMREILSLVTDSKQKALQNKASINWHTVGREMMRYQLGDLAMQNWREELGNDMAALVVTHGGMLEDEFERDVDLRGLLTDAWFREYQLRFAQPINDTTAKGIGKLIDQGVKEGWSIPRMSERLELLFRQWMDGNTDPEDWQWYEDRMPTYRRDAIARTETIRVSNATSQAIFEGWDVPAREWLATADNRTRDTHMEAWRKYSARGSVGPIPLDQPFTVGGYSMMYPGDGSMGVPPGEFVNCRCTTIPYLGRG